MADSQHRTSGGQTQTNITEVYRGKSCFTLFALLLFIDRQHKSYVVLYMMIYRVSRSS